MANGNMKGKRKSKGNVSKNIKANTVTVAVTGTDTVIPNCPNAPTCGLCKISGCCIEDEE